MAGRRGRRGKQLLYDRKGNERILEIERGSNRSHCVENSVWKRLWTCHTKDYGFMNAASMSKFLRFVGNVLPRIQRVGLSPERNPKLHRLRKFASFSLRESQLFYEI